MDRRKVIRDFYHHFEKMNLEGVLALFDPRAMVHSPTLGKKDAPKFYREMFSKSKQIKVVINDIFINPDQPHRLAAFTNLRWKMKDGEDVNAEVIVIFEINAEGKIQMVHIIYDAQAARDALRKAG